MVPLSSSLLLLIMTSFACENNLWNRKFKWTVQNRCFSKCVMFNLLWKQLSIVFHSLWLFADIHCSHCSLLSSRSVNWRRVRRVNLASLVVMSAHQNHLTKTFVFLQIRYKTFRKTFKFWRMEYGDCNEWACIPPIALPLDIVLQIKIKILCPFVTYESFNKNVVDAIFVRLLSNHIVSSLQHIPGQIVFFTRSSMLMTLLAFMYSSVLCE